MKNSFVFFLFALFLFSCNKDNLDTKQEYRQALKYEVLTKEAISEMLSQSNVIDPVTNAKISREELVYKDTEKLLTPCGDLDVKVFRTENVDNCCMYTVNVYHEDYDSGPIPIDLEVYIDGNFHFGVVSGVVGVSFPVRVCNGSSLVEIYSGGVLCFSQTLNCKGETCCSQLDYSLTSYQDGDCCVFEFTVNDPSECWDGAMAFQFNSDIGPPDTFIWTQNGVIVHICDPEQRIRFLVWESLTSDDFCYVSPWFTSNSCKS